jgi:hypothetical protein
MGSKMMNKTRKGAKSGAVGKAYDIPCAADAGKWRGAGYRLFQVAKRRRRVPRRCFY